MYQEERQLSSDGYEMTWQVNALAPFLLTSLLLDCVTGRIVNVSSAAAAQGIDFEDLEQVGGAAAAWGEQASGLPRCRVADAGLLMLVGAGAEPLTWSCSCAKSAASCEGFTGIFQLHNGLAQEGMSLSLLLPRLRLCSVEGAGTGQRPTRWPAWQASCSLTSWRGGSRRLAAELPPIAWTPEQCAPRC